MTQTICRDSQAGHHRRWQAHVTALAQSGLSRAEYCRQHDLSYHALTYWQRKLSRSRSNTTSLVPVTLETMPAKKAVQAGRADLHIVLPGNMSIAVGDNFSTTTLSRLLTVLEGR